MSRKRKRKSREDQSSACNCRSTFLELEMNTHCNILSQHLIRSSTEPGPREDAVSYLAQS
eukprot:425581-Rhodomonas_salina.1